MGSKRPHKNLSGLQMLVQAFGAKLRQLRQASGLSQEELAARCELDRTYIGGIERGERNPSLKNIYLIAAALDVAVSDLFSGPYETKGKRVGKK